MPKFKRTEIVKFPSSRSEESAKSYWGKLGDPVTIQEYGAVNSLHVCPTDSKLVAATSYSKVQVYNLETRELHKSFTKFQDSAFCGRWRRDGGLLCAGTGQGQVKVFDVNTKTMLRVLKGHTAATQTCDFTVDSGGTGSQVVSWSDDKTVRVWDLPTESVVDTFTGHSDYVRAGALVVESPDLVVSGSYDHSLGIWDRRLGNPDTPSIKLDHGAPVEACLVLPGGGLLVSAGGTVVKIWDLVAGGRLLASLSPHHKTVTSLSLAGRGNCLISGSLDRQVHWTDLTTFRGVFSMHYPASVMSVVVAGEDNCLVAGMLDGLVQFHTRREDKIVNGMKTDTKRYRKSVSHRYLKHTQFTASPGDVVVGEDRRDIELKHDHLLRKFEYSKALDAVLKPYVARRKPEYTYSLMLELVRREGLKTALAGREEKGLSSILQFVNKYITDSRFSKTLIYVAELLIDLYLPDHGMSSSVDKLFLDLRRRLDREVTYIEELMVLQGAVDLVLAAASCGGRGSRELEKIDHRLVDLAL